MHSKNQMLQQNSKHSNLVEKLKFRGMPYLWWDKIKDNKRKDKIPSQQAWQTILQVHTQYKVM